jgi:ligand-binding sensor domain-containing protein
VTTLQGAEWTTYTQQQGLVNDYVNAIAFDQEGNTWLGTRNGISVIPAQSQAYENDELVRKASCAEPFHISIRESKLTVSRHTHDVNAATITMYDMLGRSVWRRNEGKAGAQRHLNIPLTGIRTGRYVCVVQYGKNKCSKSLVIAR